MSVLPCLLAFFFDEQSVFDYTQILFAALFGFMIFHEVPDRYSIAGYIIICAIAIILFLKRDS